MTTCTITGDAIVTRTIVPGQPDRLGWEHADPAIHITNELLELIDDRERAFLEARYELGEPCPDRPDCVHARLRTVEESA